MFLLVLLFVVCCVVFVRWLLLFLFLDFVFKICFLFCRVFWSLRLSLICCFVFCAYVCFCFCCFVFCLWEFYLCCLLLLFGFSFSFLNICLAFCFARLRRMSAGGASARSPHGGLTQPTPRPHPHGTDQLDEETTRRPAGCLLAARPHAIPLLFLSSFLSSCLYAFCFLCLFCVA